MVYEVIMESEPISKPMSQPHWSRSRAFSLGVGLSISTVAIWAAATFERQHPPAPPEMAGVEVSGSSIQVAPHAPQWKTLELGPAEPAEPYWTDSVPARITVDETRTSRVGAALSGRASKVFVELGQTVKLGTPLFSVASADLAMLQAERAKAKVELETTRVALDRVSAIVKARALPEKEQVSAEQQVKQAEVDARVAQAKLDSLKVTLNSDNEFVVRSPRDGIVVEKSVLPGQPVDSLASSLMMVADLSSVWVVAELFESDGTSVNPGAKARVSLTSLPGVTLEGEVEMVSSVVDPERHSVPIRVRLDNPEGKLKPNTYARMQFLSPPLPGSVQVAATAMVSDGARQYVYVRGADGRFVARDVVTGPTRAGKTLVLSGLKPGETVVERGAILLDNQISLSS
jgi:RND family efflux transporter MFP subunit